MDKTLVIGLGGTGQKSLLKLKKNFIDMYGEVPPMVKFLAIDTDAKESSEDTEFDMDEFLKLEISEPETVLKYPDVKKWIPDVPRWIFAGYGAAQTRPAGRLYLHANFEEVRDQLNLAYQNLLELNVGDSDDLHYSFVNPDQMNIYIVSSLAGGTGSGTIVDIAAILKNLVNGDPATQMIGILLFPDIFSEKPACDKIFPNTYAAMREINSFFSSRNGYVPGYRGQKFPCPNGLFDHHFIINNQGNEGHFNEVDELVEYIGLSLFHFISTFSEIIDQIYWSIMHHYMNQLKGQWARFSSFGISEIQYPIAEHIKQNKLKIAKDFFENMNLGEGKISTTNTKKLTRDTVEFVKSIDIEEHQEDQLIDSLSQDFIQHTSLRMPKEQNKKSLKQMVNNKVDNYVKKEIKLINEHLDKNKNAILKDTISEINEEISSLLFNPRKGIGYTKVFLSNMIGFVDGYIDEMEEEKKDFKKKKKRHEERFKEIKSECADDADRFMFGGRKIEQDFQDIERSVKLINSVNLEIERREAAAKIFLRIKEELNTWKEKIDNLSIKSGDLIEKLSKEIRNLNNRQNTSPFIQKIDLKKEKIKTEIRVNEFIKWLSAKKNITIDQFIEMDKNGMEKVVLDYISTFDEIKEMKNNTIKTYFSKLPKKEKVEKLQSLESFSNPMWSYDTGETMGFHIRRDCLFGVGNSNTVDDDLLSAGLKDPQIFMKASTADPYKFICFQFETGCPAFVIKNLAQYRKEYEFKKGEGVNIFHTQKGLESKLAPLFPDEESEIVDD